MKNIGFKILQVFLLSAIIFLSGCEKGGPGTGRNIVHAGDKTFRIEGCLVDQYSVGSRRSNYEVVLCDCATWEEYNDSEWELYFDLYFEGAVYELQEGRYELNDGTLGLGEASLTYYSRESDSYEEMNMQSGNIEIRKLRSGDYSISFSGEDYDGREVTASYSGLVDMHTYE